MSQDYAHYPASFIMRSKDSSGLRIIDVWKFRSTKSKRWYIIEMEHFDNNLIAIKFYCKSNRLSKNKYSIMTNDNEPRTIIYSCLELMKRYYLLDNTVSFGFYAEQDLNPKKQLKHSTRRFRFYKLIVTYYFGEESFVHIQDNSERIYLLLNKRQLLNGSLSLQAVAKQINSVFKGNFSF